MYFAHNGSIDLSIISNLRLILSLSPPCEETSTTFSNFTAFCFPFLLPASGRVGRIGGSLETGPGLCVFVSVPVVSAAPAESLAILGFDLNSSPHSF